MVLVLALCLKCLRINRFFNLPALKPHKLLSPMSCLHHHLLVDLLQVSHRRPMRLLQCKRLRAYWVMQMKFLPRGAFVANKNKRGRRAFRWGQMAPGDLAHNPLNTQLPGHLSQVGSNEGERSVLIMDNRDNRIQSPFQGWLINEVLTNALSYVNIKSDRSLVRSPSSGYHFSLFMVRSSHRSWSRSSKAGE